MSWLINDLANKAEALLDRVDQSAASALTDGDKPGENADHRRIGNLPSSISVGILREENARSKEQQTASVPLSRQLNRSLPPGDGESLHIRGSSTGAMVGNQRPTLPRVASVPSLKRKEEEEKELFEFLNSGPSHSLPTQSPLKMTTAADKTDGRGTTPELGNSGKMAPQMQSPDAVQGPNPLGATKPHVPAPSHVAVDVGSGECLPGGDAKALKRVSQLQLENKLLKTEVASLNEEAAGAVQKMRAAQEELASVKHEQQQQQRNVHDYQQAASSLLSKEQDYVEALKAKDSQLAVLRVRVQESDEELSKKTELLRKMQGDNERILKDHSASSGLQGVALDNVRWKLEESDRLLREERERSAKTQDDFVGIQNRLQEEQQSMALAVKSLQIKLNEEKAKSRDSQHLLRSSSEASESAVKELQEYKDKAAKIFQAKEKLIASLKHGSSTGDFSPMVATELDGVISERDSLREELQQMRYRLEQTRTELRDNDHRHQVEADEQLEQIQDLETSLDEQRGSNNKLANDLKVSSQDVRYLQEDMHKVKLNTQKQLADRDAEIVTLKHQLTISSSSTSSQQELESRIHSLTDNLIQKQTLVEALSTEKNSLFLQLERLEQQYRSVQDSLSKQLNLSRNEKSFTEHDSEAGSRPRSIASIMPSQMQNSNHVKSTVNGMDRFSIRLGRLLRQYPAARLFVILYMLALHLWVTIVLLTYQPEVHSGSFMPTPP